MTMDKNLKTDHGGKAYKDSGCALKINEKAAAKICLYYANSLIMTIAKPMLEDGSGCCITAQYVWGRLLRK